ncbi:hypothetical protein H5410_035826 [Solanum commersonii]|uniref:Uncharacterized protein n=1 Tax=Solanum commersonii TaxID=4109 RepID=A0A9J5Y3Q2_SOLCO|nr:hypothetical protein H5410_035826 [Solanum commersonii]
MPLVRPMIMLAKVGSPCIFPGDYFLISNLYSTVPSFRIVPSFRSYPYYFSFSMGSFHLRTILNNFYFLVGS